jgi:enoyl-CoA hydratase/carnithine racemase
VAAQSAAFAAPGGRGGWFCTTPMVAIGRCVSRKRALELALTGDTIDAETALAWGLVNRVVPDGDLDAATVELLEKATRGGVASKALGKQAFYTQIDLDIDRAYGYAVEVMAAASQLDDAREGMAAFLEKRPPVWPT